MINSVDMLENRGRCGFNGVTYTDKKTVEYSGSESHRLFC